MKHPHASVISQWLEDTTQEIEQVLIDHKNFRANISEVIGDSCGKRQFQIKPKQDQYEHLRQAVNNGKYVEWFSRDDSKWIISIDYIPAFNLPLDKYRIHDPCRELKEAQEQGKRVVKLSTNGTKWIDSIDHLGNSSWSFNEDADRYKIVDHDVIQKLHICNVFEKEDKVFVKFTKCGITGKITPEVVND